MGELAKARALVAGAGSGPNNDQLQLATAFYVPSVLSVVRDSRIERVRKVVVIELRIPESGYLKGLTY